MTAPGRLRLARLGVSLLFFANAYGFGNVVPRLPELKSSLELSNTALGAAVAAFPTAALLTSTVVGHVVHRVGTGRAAAVATAVSALVVSLVGVAPGWGVLALLYALGGVADIHADTGMNAHGLRVQHELGRSIINQLHGFWSIGAVAGGLTGTAATGLGVDLRWHLLAVGAAIAVAAVVAWRTVLPGQDPVLRPGDDGHDPTGAGGGRPVGRRSFAGVLAVMGLVLVMAATVEDAPATWGALLLRDDLGAGAVLAGLSFPAFQACMTMGRLTGDRVTERFGTMATVRTGGVAAAVALALALAWGNPVGMLVGFGIAGAGTATLFPAVYHAAGNLPGLGAGHGLSVVSALSRVGFLAVPPLVGVIADAASVRSALWLSVVAAVVVVLLAPTLGPRRREVRGGRPRPSVPPTG